MSLDVRTEQRLRRIERLMTARLVLLIAILGAALALARVDRSFSEGGERGLYGTIVFAFLSTVGFAAAFPRIRRVARFGAALVATDLVTITALVHYTGGSESVFAPFFLLVVVSTAVLFGRVGAYGAATLSAASFGAVLVGERVGILGIYGGAPPVRPVEFAHWAVHAGAQIVVGLLASGLSRELDRTGEDLERSRSDLRRLQSLHERTVESLLSGLLTTDMRGVITSFNPEAEHITAISEESAVGRSIDEMLPGARKCVMRSAEVGRTGRTRAQILYENRLGATLHLGLSGSILREADGSAAGHVVIFQDVTQVVEMEGELRRSERQAAIGRLSAAIAHEIRNPLAAISGSIQMLRSASHAAGDDDSRRLMEIVLRETERLDGLLTDFLQYARPAPPKLASVLLASLVQDLVEMFERSRSGEHPIEVRVDIAEGLAVMGDASQLRQLLWNLYLNAVQAMPQGGRLLIAAKEVSFPPQGHASAGRNAPEGEGTPFLELVVTDSGVGIAPDVIDRIFDPFFTTRREGSGLGLATVHRIVESHGGSLRVESTVGAGTTFRIRLPQAEEPL